jgi:hypothetical protein
MIMKTTLAAAALLAIGAANPVLAQNGDSNINNFVRQSPQGMVPTTNGTPVITGNREGQPVIEYRGPRGPGVQDGGVPRIVDNREGQPVIRYGAGPEAGDTTNSSGQQAAAAANGRNLRGGMGRSGAASNAVAPLLQSARASLQRGRYGSAATTLEQAETRLLNSGDEQGARAISQARAAANKGDRNTAMQSLNQAMQQLGG